MIFIFLLALILFGPKKLPEIAREVGKFVAEFKRASNDFKYQLQNEIEKAGVETTSADATGSQSTAQQTTSFTQTLLPPAVKNAISAIDSAHERLLNTARVAFDTQTIAPRPSEPAVEEPAEAKEPTTISADSSAPGTDAVSVAAVHESSSAAADQPTPDPAPAKSDSAIQSS